MPEASNIYSRWLSKEGATPPDKIHTIKHSTPEGVPEARIRSIPIVIETGIKYRLPNRSLQAGVIRVIGKWFKGNGSHVSIPICMTSKSER